jgi:hypothetical protein
MKGIKYNNNAVRSDTSDYIFDLQIFPEGQKYEVRTSIFYKQRFEWLYKKLYNHSEKMSSFACLNYLKKAGHAEYIKRKD